MWGQPGRARRGGGARNGQNAALLLMLLQRINNLDRKPPLTLALMGARVRRAAVVHTHAPSDTFANGRVLCCRTHVRAALPEDPLAVPLSPVLVVRAPFPSLLTCLPGAN